MSIHFVYRSHYSGPSEKYVRTFDDESVLAWFQNRWQRLSSATGGARPQHAIYEAVKAEMGLAVYGFSTIFEAVAKESLPAPEDAEELQEALESHLYVEGEIDFREHCLQVFTDDDELQLAYYFFDDHFLAENPGIADFLLHADWKLPTDVKEAPGEFIPRDEVRTLSPGGSGPGATYAVFLTFYDSGNLEGFPNGYTLPGLRLPELVSHLAQEKKLTDWPAEMFLLRGALTSPTQSLESALERWRGHPLVDIGGGLPDGLGTGPLAKSAREFAKLEAELPEVGCDPARSLLQVTPHLAQAAFSVRDAEESNPLYHQWIFFDDLWAASHPDLAQGLLRFAARWDVLTVEEGDSE